MTNIIVESHGEFSGRRVREALRHVIDVPLLVLWVDKGGQGVDLFSCQVCFFEDTAKIKKIIKDGTTFEASNIKRTGYKYEALQALTLLNRDNV